MQTKYQKLTEAVRVAMLALDAADAKRVEASSAWKATGKTFCAEHDAVVVAMDERDAAQRTLTAAKRALVKHCEMVRAELASMQDGGL